VPHDEENPVPVPPHAGADETDSSDENPEDDVTADESYDEDFEEGRPHLLSKDDLDDLVRDLSLSKEKSELLASRLREWNLLQKGTTTSHFRDRHKQLVTYYKLENDICFCTDVNALMLKLGCEYVPDQWRLFIDSSKASLKAVLLHNGNEKPSVPIAHAVGLKETYDSMKLILKVINYSEHNWNICADLKVVSLVLGLQLGYTNICVFCACGIVAMTATITQ
jgi:hypothetical protein